MGGYNLRYFSQSLLFPEPLFAAFARHVTKVATRKIPTAAASFNKNSLRYELLYNPDFFKLLIEKHISVDANELPESWWNSGGQALWDEISNSTNKDETTRLVTEEWCIKAANFPGWKVGAARSSSNNDPKRYLKGVLMHELYHMLLGHLSFRCPSYGVTQGWNIATDLAINSFLGDNIPGWTLIPGRRAEKPHEELEQFFEGFRSKGKKSEDEKKETPTDPPEWLLDLIENFPVKQSAEYYYQRLMKAAEENNCAGALNSLVTLDDHSWSRSASGSEEDAEAFRMFAGTRAKKILKEAVEECEASSGWGSIPQEMRSIIQKLIQNKIDWRSVLKYFVGQSQRASKSSSMKRINRRYPYQHPGTKIKRHARIAISVDQSGSVGDEMLQLFFAELTALARLAEFTVIPFDHGLAESDIFVWRKGLTLPEWKRVRCGGTDFSIPTQFVNDGKFDGHIILTDMQADKPIRSKCHRMWMTTPGCNVPFEINERVLVIE